MAKTNLHEDATLKNLIETLDDADEYIRRALGNFAVEERKVPGSRLKIGVMGKGVYPNYRIDVPFLQASEDFVLRQTAKVFNGRTHQILNEPNKVRGVHWSNESMGFEELKTLYNELRALKGKTPI